MTAVWDVVRALTADDLRPEDVRLLSRHLDPVGTDDRHLPNRPSRNHHSC
jgi:hypothetical protein